MLFPLIIFVPFFYVVFKLQSMPEKLQIIPIGKKFIFFPAIIW